jgi:hypothetical protein
MNKCRRRREIEANISFLTDVRERERERERERDIVDDDDVKEQLNMCRLGADGRAHLLCMAR